MWNVKVCCVEGYPKDKRQNDYNIIKLSYIHKKSITKKRYITNTTMHHN